MNCLFHSGATATRSVWTASVSRHNCIYNHCSHFATLRPSCFHGLANSDTRPKETPVDKQQKRQGQAHPETCRSAGASNMTWLWSQVLWGVGFDVSPPFCAASSAAWWLSSQWPAMMWSCTSGVWPWAGHAHRTPGAPGTSEIPISGKLPSSIFAWRARRKWAARPLQTVEDERISSAAGRWPEAVKWHGKQIQWNPTPFQVLAKKRCVWTFENTHKIQFQGFSPRYCVGQDQIAQPHAMAAFITKQVLGLKQHGQDWEWRFHIFLYTYTKT